MFFKRGLGRPPALQISVEQPLRWVIFLPAFPVDERSGNATVNTQTRAPATPSHPSLQYWTVCDGNSGVFH